MEIPRIAAKQLARLLSQFPAVAVVGPRQVGKTTLAQDYSDSLKKRALYLDLELQSDLAKLSDPELYFSTHEKRLLILDEIQRLPQVFQTLRGVIDKRRRAGKRVGQFLLLGSASIDLLHQSSESLAGRVAYLELTPLTIREVLKQLPDASDDLWLRGGFPDSLLADDDETSFAWRSQFIQTYLERDVPALGPRIPAETLRRFWQMLAHNQGQLLNSSQIATGLGVSGQTVARYLDVMVDLLLVRRLQPWEANVKKRLVRAPKVYVRDSGLVHALLGIREMEELLGHPVVGFSWEGMVIENILDSLPAKVQTGFYRTYTGAEIDLVIVSGKQRWAIEIKRSISNPKPRRGFHEGCEDIKATRQIVIYPGVDRFRLNDQIEVMPVSEFLLTLKIFHAVEDFQG